MLNNFNTSNVINQLYPHIASPENYSNFNTSNVINQHMIGEMLPYA